MKNLFTFTLTVTALVAAHFLFAPSRPGAVVHAQSTQPASCSNATLQGSYGGVGSGYYGTPNGTGLFAGIALFTTDGNGNFTGTQTVSQNGQVLTVSVTGTYQVNSNCTGTAQTLLNGQVANNLGFVIVNGGHGIRYMQTDANTVISGSLDQQ